MLELETGQKVKVEKILHWSDEVYTNEDAASRIEGQGNGVEEGHYLEGFLLREIKADDIIIIARTKRKEVEAEGMFTSSPIKEVFKKDSHYIVKTNNSVYRVEPI